MVLFLIFRLVLGFTNLLIVATERTYGSFKMPGATRAAVYQKLLMGFRTLVFLTNITLIDDFW